MDCLDNPAITVLSVLNGIIAAVNLLLAVWFAFTQFKLKGRDAITRFSILAVLLPIGVAMCTGSNLVTVGQKVCWVPVNQVADNFTGIGLSLATASYLCFIFLRSQALLSKARKIIFSILVWGTILLMLAQIITFYGGLIPNPNELEMTVMSIMGLMTGVLTIICDVSFFAVFANHLRYMKLKLGNWWSLNDQDDAMRVIAKTGIRCTTTLFCVCICNFIAIFASRQSGLVFEVFFFLTMVMFTFLTVHIMVMKFKVDQAQSRATSKVTNSELGSTLKTTGTRDSEYDSPKRETNAA